MKNSLVNMIELQTNVLFKNIQITLDEITDMQLIPEISDMPLWKHVYHMLHSLDQWYINPSIYDEPDFHKDNLNSLFIISDKMLKKEELQKYFNSIKIKIQSYLGTLKDDDLECNPEGYKFSKLVLILGQFRHASYHMGMIHSFIRSKSGKWPTFMGLSESIKLKEN